MLLTEVEREVTKTVVDRFLSQKEGTARRPLVRKFKDQDVLDRLVRYGILRTNDQVNFFPTAFGFHCCEDEAIRSLAKRSAQIVLHVLQNLFETDEEEREYTAAEIEEQARKMYDNVEPQNISLGLYLAQDFGAFGLIRRDPQQIEIVGVKVGEHIVTIKDSDSAWDEHVRLHRGYLERQRGPEQRQAFLQRLYEMAGGREGATISPMQFFGVGANIGLSNDSVGQMIRHFLSEDFVKQKPASEAIALTHKGVLEVEREGASVIDAKQREGDVPDRGDIVVLISHSSKDKVLAQALIDLLRAGLGLLASQIRCSSVDGYRLPAGSNTHDQLRREIKSVGVLIGLLTPNSLSSTYVLFELGARWGAELFMIPLLAGTQPEEMRGPHGVLNALTCETEGQLIQLVEDCGKELNISPQSAASYLAQVRAVQALAKDMVSTVGRPARKEEMVFEESVRWKRTNGGREGPYCPVCYEDKQKEIHLNPGATKGTYGCGVCQNSFTTNEFDPRPVRRRPFSSGRR